MPERRSAALPALAIAAPQNSLGLDVGGLSSRSRGAQDLRLGPAQRSRLMHAAHSGDMPRLSWLAQGAQLELAYSTHGCLLR